MVKIRLQRQGRKKDPIYRLVATDSRNRRDGRFNENLGQYRPSNEAGAKITFNEDRVMYWLGVGAQPSTTVRALLSKEGTLLKWHLQKKNVEPARAEEILTTWKSQRDAKIANHETAKQTAAENKRRAAEEAKRKVEEDARKAEEDARKAEADAKRAEEEAAAAPAGDAVEEAAAEAPVAEAEAPKAE